MWAQRRRRGGHHHGDLYAYLVAIQAAMQFLEQRRTGPVTLALIAANVAVYLRPGPLDSMLPSTGEVCLNPSVFLRTWDWRRLLLSGFYHVDDTHLIYNMVSLLWKGLELEAQLGSARFAATTGALLVLGHGALVGVAQLLSVVLEIHDPFYKECAVGFSGVLFGFKTLLSAGQPSYSYVGGVRLPTKYAAWGELLLIQMLVPDASFLGHLCGILAACMLLWAPRALAALPWLVSPWQRRVWGSGTSGYSMRQDVRRQGRADTREDVSARQDGQRQGQGGLRHDASTRQDGRWQGQAGPRRDAGGRREGAGGWGAGGAPAASPALGNQGGVAGIWECGACTFHNSLALARCDMCGTERQAEDPATASAPGLPEEVQRANGQGLSPEELRLLRLARFSQGR